MIFPVLDPSPLTVCINCSFFTFIKSNDCMNDFTLADTQLDWPFLHVHNLTETLLFSTLILGSVFSDCVVFYEDIFCFIDSMHFLCHLSTDMFETFPLLILLESLLHVKSIVFGVFIESIQCVDILLNVSMLLLLGQLLYSLCLSLSTHTDGRDVDIYRLLFVCLFVCLCVCTVTDFSAEDKTSGVKLFSAVHRRPRQ